MKAPRHKLTECCPQGDGLHVDQAGGVIAGVKVLGFESKNRRRYLPEAASAALPMYEGAVVNLDHPDQPGQSRSVKDRFARLVNARVEGDGIRADLRYNPKHAFAPAIEWFAENDPAAIGLSHNAVGEGKQEGGVFVVKKIVELRSVDLVADPATTKGLFEGTDMDPELDADVGGDEGGGDEGYEAQLGHLIVACLKDPDLDVKAKRKKILKALKLLDDEPAASGDADTEEGGDEGKDMENGKPRESDDDYEESVDFASHKDPAVRELAERYDRLEAKVKLDARREKVREACKAAKLPPVVVTDLFVEQLVHADDKTAKLLIEDRRQLAGVKLPRSASPGGDKGMDVKEFARQLRKGA